MGVALPVIVAVVNRMVVPMALNFISFGMKGGGGVSVVAICDNRQNECRMMEANAHLMCNLNPDHSHAEPENDHRVQEHQRADDD